jgi:hypothetical protein
MMGIIFSLLEATFSMSSLATRIEDSIAKITPELPIISEMWLTVVPVDAPK